MLEPLTLHIQTTHINTHIKKARWRGDQNLDQHAVLAGLIHSAIHHLLYQQLALVSCLNSPNHKLLRQEALVGIYLTP